MTLLWRFDEFSSAVGGTFEGVAPAKIEGISIDSRTIAPGEAFFAIRGDAMDGHDYAAHGCLGPELGFGWTLGDRNSCHESDENECCEEETGDTGRV